MTRINRAAGNETKVKLRLKTNRNNYFNETVIINVYPNCNDQFQLDGLKSTMRVAN